MRGILVLAFGVGLVLLGIRSSIDGGEGADRGDGDVAMAARRAAGEAADAAEVAGESDPVTSDLDHDAVAETPAPDPGAEGGWDERGAEEPAAVEQGIAEGALAGVVEDGAVLRQASFSPEGFAPPAVPFEGRGSATFELGGPLGDPGEVGELLLGAWLAQDPARLQGYLNEGAGSDLPATRRRLVVAFWQAAVGELDAAEATLEDLDGAKGVTRTQLDLLASAVRFDGAMAAQPAGRRDPLARAMSMILLDARAEDAWANGEHAEAARGYSELLLLEVSAPWPPHRATLLVWGQALNRAQAGHRFDPRGDWPSIEHVVRPNESLILIRKLLKREHPEILTCTGLLRAVNGVGKYIHPGDPLRVPTDEPSVLVDLDARVALYRHGNEVLRVYEIGIGVEGHETPTGTFVAGEKQPEPSWMPQGRPQRPYGHPDNPLGTRWIGWFQNGQKTSYGFHGTSEPQGVGGRVSQGCVRMRNDDVEQLYELLPLNARVIVQP